MRAPIPLNEAMTERAHNLRSAQREIWEAASADGVWWFRRAETPGTPWEITHLPTGMTDTAGSLEAAQRLAADPATLRILRERAQHVVDTDGQPSVAALKFIAGRPVHVAEPAERVALRYGLALRAVHIFDGLLVPGDPDGLCMCGGMLLGDRHADVCRECLGGTLAEVRACRLLHEHRACARPEDQLCDHARCVRPARPAGADECRRAKDTCCGCCHEHG